MRRLFCCSGALGKMLSGVAGLAISRQDEARMEAAIVKMARGEAYAKAQDGAHRAINK